MATTSLDLLCMGRSSIDLYAHEVGAPITSVKSFDAYVGGCPTNVAVGTRRLGVRSGLLTGVGTDQVGDFVLHFLQQEGVDVSAVPRFRERRTSAVDIYSSVEIARWLPRPSTIKSSKSRERL